MFQPPESPQSRIPDDRTSSGPVGNRVIEAGPDPLLGTVIGDRYKVMYIIGAGGMGVVYKGCHVLMDKPVAIKMLHDDAIREPTSKERFRQEAKLASRLSHTNVVTVHDYGMLGDSPYIVMDFIEGRSVSDVLDAESAIGWQRSVDLMIQICNGVDHAHQQGLIHRDLKSANIMLVRNQDGSEVAKVLDFGLARPLVPDNAMPNLTESGMLLGTVSYMSPEQCRGRQADVRSDVYALGCIAYEMITGQPPLRGDNLLDTIALHIEKKPAPMKEIRPDLDIPDWLEQCVERALAKEPEKRQQSVGEFRAALVSGKQAQGTAAGAVVNPPLKLTRGRLSPVIVTSVAGAAVAAAVALGTVFFAVPRDKTNTSLPVSNSQRQSWQRHYHDAEAAFNKGDYASSERLLRVALPEAQNASSHADLILTMHKLADTLYAEQKYTEAEKLERDIRMDGFRNGGATGDTSASKDNHNSSESEDDHLARLAATCHKNGQCDVAAHLLERSLDISRQTYGSHSPQTVSRISELASFYMGLGMVDKAQPLLNEVVGETGGKKPAPGAVSH